MNPLLPDFLSYVRGDGPVLSYIRSSGPGYTELRFLGILRSSHTRSPTKFTTPSKAHQAAPNGIGVWEPGSPV
jgi:hypothetical protein